MLKVSHDMVTKLGKAQSELNQDVFKNIFGESKSLHLWDQYYKLYRANLLGFYYHLGFERRQALLQYINERSF